MKITFQRDLLFNTFKQVIKTLAKAFIYDNIHSPNYYFFYFIFFFYYVSQRTEVTFEGQKIIPKDVTPLWRTPSYPKFILILRVLHTY